MFGLLFRESLVSTTDSQATYVSVRATAVVMGKELPVGVATQQQELPPTEQFEYSRHPVCAVHALFHLIFTRAL